MFVSRRSYGSLRVVAQAEGGGDLGCQHDTIVVGGDDCPDGKLRRKLDYAARRPFGRREVEGEAPAGAHLIQHLPPLRAYDYRSFEPPGGSEEGSSTVGAGGHQKKQAIHAHRTPSPAEEAPAPLAESKEVLRLVSAEFRLARRPSSISEGFEMGFSQLKSLQM